MRIFDNNEQVKNLDLLKLSRFNKIAIFILYCLALAYTVIAGVYIITYFLFIAIFLVFVSSIGGYKIINKLLNLSRWQIVLFIFLTSLLLRILMLTQTQVITHDLEMYVYRSESMLEGRLPYIDFSGGSKPPLYHFMLFLMGFLFTPGVVQFRAVFSVFDSFIPVALFFICAQKYNEHFAFVSSLIYALFPIGIICVGLSGHYDSVVALFTLISIYMLFNKKLKLSGLSLGVAFALKLYPIVLLPFFLTTFKSWKARFSYVIIFLIPSILSLIGLFIFSPSAFFKYFEIQTGWEGSSAISSIIEMMLNSTRIFSIKISWIVFGIFGLLNLFLFIDWLSPKRHLNLIKWFKIMIAIFVIYYGFYLIYGVLYYNNPLYMALIPVIIYFPIMAFILRKYLHKIVPRSLAEPNSEELFIVSAFAIMLFLFGLPNYAPWYFIWFFPFILAIKTDKIRYFLLWILPWHGIGRDMSLIPGSQRIN